MDFEFYRDIFKKSAERLDKGKLDKKHLDVSVGVVLNSVFLKLYKREWTSDPNDPLNAEARIFFSIWVNDKTLQANRIYYNIHALKIRKLKGYSMLSREFSERYRTYFKKHQANWENVNVSLGPLTLMEGWTEYNTGNPENTIAKLADNFSEIDYLIDETLETFRK